MLKHSSLFAILALFLHTSVCANLNTFKKQCKYIETHPYLVSSPIPIIIGSITYKTLKVGGP